MSNDALAASDPRRSAWVSANAGAGKTHTLANRVTRLLLAGGTKTEDGRTLGHIRSRLGRRVDSGRRKQFHVDCLRRR